jgi:hypothetical protein
MTNNKIIRIRGQCRGRPPTRGAPRDGLGSGSVGSCQLAVDGLQSAVGGQQSAAWCMPYRARGPGTVDPLGVMRRQQSLKQRFRIAVFGFLKSEIRNQKSTFRSHLARDWVSFTCFVDQKIRHHRHKHRLKDWLNLLKMAGRESYAWT